MWHPPELQNVTAARKFLRVVKGIEEIELVTSKLKSGERAAKRKVHLSNMRLKCSEE
jgi:hypothetical protein